MKFKTVIEISPLSGISEVPDLKGKGFYVIAICGEWQTNATKSFKDNLNIFGTELKHNYLIKLLGNNLSEGRHIFEAHIEQDPTIVVTADNPNKWNHDIKKLKIIKISMGGMDYDSVATSLMKISQLLLESEKDSFQSINWQARVIRVKKILKNVPIIGLMSLVF